MTSAFDGSSIDGPLYRDIVDLAHRSPVWLDDTVTAWSAYGLGLFALLMVVAWWRARRKDAVPAVTALAAPLIVVLAYAVNDGVKLLVREDRPCRGLPTATLEACPAPGDWSFPSNHAALAAAAAVALLFVSRRLGALALLAACAMAASRVWVGVHYPHDVLVGFAVGALVAAALAALVVRWGDTLVRRLTATRLAPLLTAA
ncbi:phosphatase PAP2 family protein [Streptomyces mobaraensis]|uniref:Phosphatase PAP2 family protein n=1 Tax=Streptomyces mobaraensis TaxID=35621 RepID=A0A5N5WCI3_STRMB|nr:phosphatase PAP2 family protein [Streptomyces mobaraensis]KAB7848418.1 phosphatase PAP2 family protein [Streptomyces mobaraensis]